MRQIDFWLFPPYFENVPFLATFALNSDITEIKVIVNGIRNKVCGQGMETRIGTQKIWKGKQRDECNRLLCRRQIRSIHRFQEYEKKVEIGEYERKSSALN